MTWSRKLDRLLRCIPPTEGGIPNEHTTTVRRGFQGKGGAGGTAKGQTIQEIATQRKIHPNQVSTWKQGAVEGMKEVLKSGAFSIATNGILCIVM